MYHMHGNLTSIHNYVYLEIYINITIRTTGGFGMIGSDEV